MLDLLHCIGGSLRYIIDDKLLVVCSGVSLQHSQSASPPDIRVYNQNLGMSVHRGPQPHTADVPQITQAPEPPPAYHGVVSARNRARNQPAGLSSESGIVGQSAGDERQMIDYRAVDSSVMTRVYSGDHMMPASPTVSTQFTSDVSLTSSNVTSFEDNGRPKVCHLTQSFHVLESVGFLVVYHHSCLLYTSPSPRDS